MGTKLLVAEALGRYDTVGIDCMAMNVNDVVCVGAEPIALLDYIAVVEADPAVLASVAEGLRRGAEDAGVEIPGGELAVVPEMVKGLDLVGACVGTVDLDAIVTGSAIEPGDAVVGLPASGVHSNGLTLARRALPDLDERPEELGGASVGETLLEPTVIYVRAVLELLRSEVDVRGLAHITGDGLLNLLRLEAEVGYRISSPLPRQPVFDLIADPRRGLRGRHARGVQPGVRVLLRGARRAGRRLRRDALGAPPGHRGHRRGHRPQPAWSRWPGSPAAAARASARADARRGAVRDDPGGEVARDHRAGPHHGVVADGHPRVHDRPGSQPHVVPHRDRVRELPVVPAKVGVERDGWR